mmetsp:Transcript_3041/g.6961  ORF Transcript_3041/g.6961 Transcript_3041/m.6961 type:complete len:240 (-) Transcript_3041:151-870(-)
MLPDLFDDAPVCWSRALSLVLSSSTVNSQNLSTGVLQALCVLQSLRVILEHPNLASDGHASPLVRLLYHRIDQLQLVHQEGPVPPPLGDALWASKVEINRIALSAHHLSSSSKDVSVVCTKLHDEGAVSGASCELLLPIYRILEEEPRVKHWSVAEMGAVPPAQHAKCKLRLFHHGSTHPLRIAHRLVQSKPRELWCEGDGAPVESVLCLLGSYLASGGNQIRTHAVFVPLRVDFGSRF